VAPDGPRFGFGIGRSEESRNDPLMAALVEKQLSLTRKEHPEPPRSRCVKRLYEGLHSLLFA
jgi:hypothetical protein